MTLVLNQAVSAAPESATVALWLAGLAGLTGLTHPLQGRRPA